MNIYQIKKGEYGYMRAYRLRKLLGTLVLCSMLSAVVIGTIVMYGDTRHAIIIIAILLVLPFAKYLTAYLVCLPFHALKSEQAEHLNTLTGEGTLLFDVVVALESGLRFYPAVYLLNDTVTALLAGGKTEEHVACLEAVCSGTIHVVEYFDQLPPAMKKAEKHRDSKDTKTERKNAEALRLHCV